MYGTCETLCRELAAKYPGDTPLMLVIWSPEEIQALADGMEISLTDHEIRAVLARMEDIPEWCHATTTGDLPVCAGVCPSG